MTYLETLEKDRDTLKEMFYNAGICFANDPQFIYACQFIYETEKYDRMICRHTNGRPVTDTEQHLCLDNAIKVKKRIREQMIDAHIDVSGFNKLIAKIDYLWSQK